MDISSMGALLLLSEAVSQELIKSTLSEQEQQMIIAKVNDMKATYSKEYLHQKRHESLKCLLDLAESFIKENE